MNKANIVVAVFVVIGSLASLANAQAPCRATEIDRLGADMSYAYDLNNWGQVVGALATTHEGQSSLIQPFVWEHGRTRLLEAPSQISEARGINGLGRVVGSMWEGSIVVPVTWARGHFARLELKFTNQGLAVGVNNRGQIIGYNSESHGLLWPNADSAPIDIGTLGGGMALPRAINDHGVIVGVAATVVTSQHAFVWEDGVMTDVGFPAHPDPAIVIVRTELEAINDDGLAIGYAQTADGTNFPLLWTRAQGARVLPDEGRAAAVNNWGTVAVVSAENELLLGGYGRPLRSKGFFDSSEQAFLLNLNDRYQLTYTVMQDDGVVRAYFCQLTP